MAEDRFYLILYDQLQKGTSWTGTNLYVTHALKAFTILQKQSVVTYRAQAAEDSDGET